MWFRRAVVSVVSFVLAVWSWANPRRTGEAPFESEPQLRLPSVPEVDGFPLLTYTLRGVPVAPEGSTTEYIEEEDLREVRPGVTVSGAITGRGSATLPMFKVTAQGLLTDASS